MWFKSKNEQYLKFLVSLAFLVEARDLYTAGHLWRTASYSRKIALKMKLPNKYIQKIIFGSLVHDLGKICISDQILNKKGSLDDTEWDLMRLHPLAGINLLRNYSTSRVINNIVLYHHEHLDGSGYPEGLVENKIPKEAKIVGVADAIDAITSSRPYRKGQNLDKACLEIEKGIGSQFCPMVSTAALDCIKSGEFDHIYKHSESNLSLLECPYCKDFTIQITPYIHAGDHATCRACTGDFILEAHSQTDQLKPVFSGNYAAVSELIPKVDVAYASRVLKNLQTNLTLA